MQAKPLTPQVLIKHANLETLPRSTKNLPSPEIFAGHERAKHAFETALLLRGGAHHVFASGASSLGKKTATMRFLKQKAKQLPTPHDYAYVNCFSNARTPIALQFEPGEAQTFKSELQTFWNNLSAQLKVKFRSEQYQKKIEQIRKKIGELQTKAYEALIEEGAQRGLKLLSEGDQHRFVVDQKEDEPKQGISKVQQQAVLHMEHELERLSIELEDLEIESEDQIHKVNEALAKDALSANLAGLKQRFKTNAQVVNHLDSLALDVVDNIESILNQTDPEFLPGRFENLPLRYQVNVLTTNEPGSGAPVIFEDMPTHYNLIGHVEQVTQMGTVTTDFTLIRPGSLHKANGGFLVLEAANLIEQPYAWQGLKRALQSKQIRLSSLEQMITLTGSISLEPDTIGLDVQVILLGEPELYYELLEFEPEFDSVFRIRADFSESMTRSSSTEHTFCCLVADMVQSHGLLHFNQSALARLIEEASRSAEHQDEISLHAGSLVQLLTETDAYAKQSKLKVIGQKQIEATLEARRYRLSHLKDLYWRDLTRGHQLISTRGKSKGQVNALTVIVYADSEFGMPARLTATAYPGSGEILDIERDVDLAGSLHAKGILIMSSYLRSRFGADDLLNFTAALTFEQNYGQIDGDSATLAEACALLSALSGLEVNQGFGITGSMNQLGQVQPIGGVNAKIEGFFDTCKLQGLNGKQGVILPEQNVSQLMLKKEVRDAVQKGKFHLYAINHVDQALELLLETPTGDSRKKGQDYPKDSIFGRVKATLESWSPDEEEEKTKSSTPAGKSAKSKAKD